MVIARSSPSGPVSNALLAGDEITVNPDLTLSPIARPRRFFDWDFFISGSVTGSTIGRMGWTLGGNGTPTASRVNSSLINTSKLLVSTSATAGDRATLLLGETETRAMCSPLEFDNVSFIGRIGTPITDKRTFFGWCDDFSVNPLSANNVLGFNYDTGVSPYLQIISRAGGSLIAAVTAIDLPPVPNNTGVSLLVIQPEEAPGFFDFYASNAPLNTAVSFIARLQNPGFNGNHGFRNETLANVTNRMDLAYWAMNSDELSGVMSSDNLLQG